MAISLIYLQFILDPFFVFRSGGKAPTLSSNNCNEFSLTSEMILELSPDGGGDTQARMKLIKELLPIFREQPLQEVNQIELIWYKTRDLLQSDSLEQRADMYSLYQVSYILTLVYRS